MSRSLAGEPRHFPLCFSHIFFQNALAMQNDIENLMPGDPAPFFTQACTANPRFVFDTAAGRYLVLCFFGSAGTPLAREARMRRGRPWRLLLENRGGSVLSGSSWLLVWFCQRVAFASIGTSQNVRAAMPLAP
jgi:hypothetical protein